MLSKIHSVTVSMLATVAIATMLFAACSQPARLDRMTTETPATVVESADKQPQIATLFLKVYGEDVGGFASHYYPLPRSDFEAALRDSIAKSELFAASAAPEDADYGVNVGLISLVAPQWSGTVTLETSWSVSTTDSGEVFARHMIREEAPSPFSKNREATEEVARKSIKSGLEWLQSALAE